MKYKKKIIRTFFLLILAIFLIIPVSSSNVTNNISETSSDFLKSAEGSTFQNIEYFIETPEWNQDGGFNDWVEDHSVNGVPVGCTGTALGMIMRTHEWPSSGRGSAHYRDWIDNTDQWFDATVNFGSTSYDYDDMPFNSANDEIARFLGHTAVSISMNWGWEIAQHHFYGFCILNDDAVNSFDETWRYSTPIMSKEPSSVIQSLRYGLPVPVGFDLHTGIITGWRESDGDIYINFGWSGGCNGWFETGPPINTPCNYVGLIHTAFPFMQPEHWVFFDPDYSGLHHTGSAKYPCDSLPDANEVVKDYVVDDLGYDHGVIRMIGGTHHEAPIVLDAPCVLTTIRGETVTIT